MATNNIPNISLGSTGQSMPVIGMGTYSEPPADLETAKLAFVEAIRAGGYRHFDTAFMYGSEQPLGEAIVEALKVGLIRSRDELFITTKLFSSYAERDLVVPAINMSLKNLQLDYVDLYLIHGPVKISQNVSQIPVPIECILPLHMESVWEGMEECQKLGLTKAIGVSNFSIKKLKEVLSTATILPAVNQVEMSPLWQQKQLREFCEEKGIHITAYSPLGAIGTKWDNRVLQCDVLEEIAKARGKTTAQVSLRWVYEQGASFVTKSFNKQRMRENLQIFDWSLTEEESKKIALLPQRKGVLFTTIFGPHDFMKELDEEI